MIGLIPVRVGGGLVVLHTREEYDRLMAGVDREAAWAHTAALDHPDREETR